MLICNTDQAKHDFNTFKKKDKFWSFSVFKCVPTEKPIFLVNGEIRRYIKNLKKTKQNRLIQNILTKFQVCTLRE